jgi:hypothetical protein
VQMFVPGPQGKVDLEQFMSPVGAQRHCWVRRVSKQLTKDARLGYCGKLKWVR